MVGARGGLVLSITLTLTLVLTLLQVHAFGGGGGCTYSPTCTLTGDPGTGGCNTCQHPLYNTACMGGCNMSSWTCVAGGACVPGNYQSCGTSGTQTCTASCMWGPCQYDCSPPNCDDRLPCQTGTCQANNQCSYTPVTDGTSCGTNMKCKAGVCEAVCASPYFCALPTPPHSTLFDQYYCVGTPKCYACQSGYNYLGGQCVLACTDECSPSGQTRCNPSNLNQTQMCVIGSAGCLVWGNTQTCPSGQTCSAGACITTDPCAAYPGYTPCSVAGNQQCNASSVQTCGYGGTQCLHWMATSVCVAPTPDCFATPPTAACVQCLSSGECTGGQTCVNNACACPSGTPTWCGSACVNTLTDPSNCGQCSRVCSGTTPACSAGACVCNSTSCPAGQNCVSGQCTASCTQCTGTYPRCDGSTLLTCAANCQSSVVCANGCTGADGGASCAAGCTPTCTVAGATQCSSDGASVQTCQGIVLAVDDDERVLAPGRRAVVARASRRASRIATAKVVWW